MVETRALSGALEDYLEAISQLENEKGYARARDVAHALSVHKSTVTAALHSLSEKGLINYSPYEMVTLTNAGKGLATNVVRRHKALSRFFTDVIGVDKKIAEANACRIEHSIGNGVMRRLNCFVEFMLDSSVPAKELPEAFREYCAERRGNGNCESCKVAAKLEAGNEIQRVDDKANTTLADLAPGEKAKIVRAGGAVATNNRLKEMGLTRGPTLHELGLTPGTPVEVEAVGPDGSVHVKVRGYSRSLSRPEAEAVRVTRPRGSNTNVHGDY